MRHTTLVLSGFVAPLLGAVAPAQQADLSISMLGSSATSWGTSGSIGAYSFGLAICNHGDFPADWDSASADHPVTTSQLYRLDTVGGATRFEQIGMSWAFHEFCALDQTMCAPSAAPDGVCGSLGRGYSTSNSASLMGSQSGLGARSEINASTGVFPHPSWVPGSTGAVGQRLQIEQSELNPALHLGALYFGEALVITRDELDPTTRLDNASHRQLLVGAFINGQYSLNFSGSTFVAQPALHAWAFLDAGVSLTNADVASDGRFVLGCDVTDLGGGWWRYEYALFNQNSHRSGQGFSVPLPAGVAVTNVGFHDVAHHSGEPYSSSDWAHLNTGAALQWATQTFAQNANANALRFGTLYNFRFDTNASPGAGSVDLALFRPGSPTSVALNAQVPALLVCPVPTTYCTAGTTSGGCNALMSSIGTPSVSSASGFTLRATPVDGGRQGLIFYGLSGASGAPWGILSTSYLCVKAPSQRTPVQSSGGTAGACDGDLAVDWLAYLASNPAALGQPFAPGASVWAQAWFRDPPTFKTTSLSNGLQFTTCP